MINMHRQWAVWAALSLALSIVAAAPPPPSTESIVVTLPPATSSTTVPTQEPSKTPNVEPVTEKPIAPVEIYSMHVISEVSSRYSKTVVSSRVANPANRAQEVTFSVLLPETAFISGFLMELEGKVYVAYVKEKEDAKKIYQEAVDSGLAAAHVTAKARDSNHFTVAVNVEANSKATFNLTYEELLTRRLGLYNDIINLNPGKIVKDMSVVVHIKENRPITQLRVPQLKSGNEIDADENYKANDIATINQSEDKKEATIRFTPTPEQQTQLRDLFREKLQAEKEKNRGRHDNYYGIWDDNDKNDVKESEGLTGQFVVQYDVERDPTKGEVLVSDGYFVHFFAPSDLKPLNKHVVFVLDISGSMIGRKIVQLKEAMLSILDSLNVGDYFSIIEFSYNSKVYDLDNPSANAVYGSHSYYGFDEPTTPKPVGPPPAPSPVTPDYISKAKEVIRNLDATGGTNINDALTTALKVVNAGVRRRKPSAAAPPAEITAEDKKEPTTVKSTDVADDKDSAAKPIKLVSTDTDITDKKVEPEPIIIFLTDGDATVGETRPDKILTTVSELNSGKKKAAIFSLAFGEDADRGFLKKLALRNDGFLRHIYEAADAAQQLKYFYQQVSSPLLAGIKFVYPADQVEENSVTKNKFHTLFLGGEIVVAGKLKDQEAVEITPTVSATSVTGHVEFSPKGPIDFIPKAPIPEVTKKHYEPTERLWAYLRIKQLLDEKDSEIEESKRPSWFAGSDSEKTTTTEKPAEKPVKEEDKPEKKALEIALKYSFVTPLTSLVVVKPNATSAVNAESVDKASNNFNGGYPQAFSSGVLPLSVGGGMPLLLQSARPAFGFAALGAPGYSASAPSSIDIADNRFDTIMDVDDVVLSAPASTTYIPPVQTSVQTSTTTIRSNSLKKYGLEAYPWLQQYLVESSTPVLELPINGSVVVLKLEVDQVNLSSVNPKCDNSVSGGPGVCKYITSCSSSSQALSSLEEYSKFFCSREGYAGVCCAEDP